MLLGGATLLCLALINSVLTYMSLGFRRFVEAQYHEPADVAADRFRSLIENVTMSLMALWTAIGASQDGC